MRLMRAMADFPTPSTLMRAFVEKRPWLVQAVIWNPRGRAEGPAALGAAVTAAPTFRSAIERMDHDVALAGPATERAIAVGAAAVFDWTSSHETCSDLRWSAKNQRCSRVIVDPDGVSNTCERKHRRDAWRRVLRAACCDPLTSGTDQTGDPGSAQAREPEGRVEGGKN